MCAALDRWDHLSLGKPLSVYKCWVKDRLALACQAFFRIRRFIAASWRDRGIRPFCLYVVAPLTAMVGSHPPMMKPVTPETEGNPLFGT